MHVFETTAQVAARLRITTRTLARWRTEGVGPAFVRIGRHKICYDRGEIDSWLAERTHRSRAAEAAAEPAEPADAAA